MESGAEDTPVQEDLTILNAGYQKRRGFASTTGQDYEVALCSLLFLRAIRYTSDFFLACNYYLAGKFDDIVLFYRSKEDQGHEYSAILLQAKHRSRLTKDALSPNFPFRIKEYFESFKMIRNQWKQPIKVGNIEIKLKEINLVLYTNSGCDIGDTAMNVTDVPEMQHLQYFLNTGGRLLRITKAQRVGLPYGQGTSDFLQVLRLCTEQMSVLVADRLLEQELSEVFNLTSSEVSRKFKTKLKREVKSWWSEVGAGRYLTAESDEWKKILEQQIGRLNSDTLKFSRQLNLDFTTAALKEFEFGHCRGKRYWISVRDEYQATVTRLRLFRALKDHLFVDVESFKDHWEEVIALWTKNICSSLIADMSNSSLAESALILHYLQEAFQIDAGRNLVVINKGEPMSTGWAVVEAVATWSLLDPPTQDRILSVHVNLQGNKVPLRDVVGSDVSDFMTDKVINLLSVCETVLQIGTEMPTPLEYYVPRCLQRISSKIINADSLQNTGILIFAKNLVFDSSTSDYEILWAADLKVLNEVKGMKIICGLCSDLDIRKECIRLCVQGISAIIAFSAHESLKGNVTEFLPFTWIYKESVVVIEGLPGIGKSSFVTAMSYKVKEQYPEAWVLRVDMGRHTQFIEERNFLNIIEIKEFLFNGLPKRPNSLERDILEHALTVTGNVFLFIDAFDEISPDYTTKCCNLLKGIAQTIRFRQMVVTTRSVTTEDVEYALETKAFSIPVFSEDEQRLFWEQFSVVMGKKVNEENILFLRESAGTILEIPLLCKMAAEVLLLRHNQSLTKYNNPWRRVLLYKLFVHQSVKNHLAEKFGLEASHPGVKKLLEYNKKHQIQNLQGLAVRKLLPENLRPKVPISKENPDEKLSLVVKTGDIVEFEHQTFGEYFLGCFLAEQWKEFDQKVLRDFLTKEGFEFVAATFNWWLFDDLHLHMEVAKGEEQAVRDLLTSRIIAKKDRGGRLGLHVAAMTQGSHRKLWQLLVSWSKDLDIKDDVLGITAVKYAKIYSNWDFIDFMLEKGAKVGVLNLFTDKNSVENIIPIVNKDLSTLCQHVLHANKEVFHKTDEFGNTILHIAAANNSTTVIKLLIEMRHKVNAKNIHGSTPLYEASRFGHLETVNLLLENGADPNVDKNNGHTALILAVSYGHVEIVKALLDKGADQNINREFGATALMVAAREGHVELVKLLIENGAEINIKNYREETALMQSVIKGHVKVIYILLLNGADPNIKNSSSDTALILATREDHQDIVKLLMKYKANPNTITNNGETALMVAASRGHLELAKILIDTGSELNMKNNLGDTALTMAIHAGHLDVVKLLLENGANPNIKKKMV